MMKPDSIWIEWGHQKKIWTNFDGDMGVQVVAHSWILKHTKNSQKSIGWVGATFDLEGFWRSWPVYTVCSYRYVCMEYDARVQGDSAWPSEVGIYVQLTFCLDDLENIFDKKLKKYFIFKYVFLYKRGVAAVWRAMEISSVLTLDARFSRFWQLKKLSI